MRHARIATASALLFSSMCLISASEIPSTTSGDHLPSIAELEQLSLTPVKLNSGANSSCTEMSAVRSLFLAYSVGSEAVSKYRDPVLTRGISGISVFKAVSPAVVVVIVGNMKNDNFDPEGMGSGAIVDARGYILTNWHVIRNHADAVIFLKPATGSDLANADARVARLVYQDPTVDLALLKIIDPPAALHSVGVGSMDQIQVAEDVHIIGHPHGNLWSYSTGVVSQIRDDYKWSYDDGSKHEAKVLQLQTAINPGNSGGPVVDDSGKILGLVAMSEEGQNLDYAIAADVIKRFLFTGMQITTRGMAKVMPDSKLPQRLFVGKLADSTPVSKAVYVDFVLYNISGKDSGLVAKFSDGTEIKAWNPDSRGCLKSWSAKLSNGKQFTAVATNGSVTQISAIH